MEGDLAVEPTQAVAMELPWFYYALPKTLEEIFPLMDTKWLFEFLANTYLHFKNSDYCGLSYNEVVFTTLMDVVVDQHDAESTRLYDSLTTSVMDIREFIRVHEVSILSHFDRLGIPEHLLDYVHVTCTDRFNLSKWHFYRPLFV